MNEMILTNYKLSLKVFIDQKAQERLYETSLSCASYANSTNPQWASEAQAFIAWRDMVYEYANEYFDQVQNGNIQENMDTFFAGMPSLIWPEQENQ